MMGDDRTPATSRSIYDGGEEDDAPWFVRADDPEGDLEDGAEPASLADWVAAEQALVRPLAAASRQLGRLEQALSHPETGPEPGGGATARLALQEASDWCCHVDGLGLQTWRNQHSPARCPHRISATSATGFRPRSSHMRSGSTSGSN